MEEKLINAALDARNRAYTPYSNFRVGSALLTAGGKIYTGANIENAAYGPTNCAERTAFFKAVFDGERDFKAIAVVGGHVAAEELEFCYPCGVCRQVMMEFCKEDFTVIVAKDAENYRVHKLSELLPYGFGPSDLAT